MHLRRALLLFGSILAIICGFAGGRVLAQTPSFTISASNATMPSRGAGSIAWTLTSVDGFAGTVNVGCVPPNPPAGAIVPTCSYGGPASLPYTLAANGTVTGTVPLIALTPPCSGPCPVELRRPGRARPGHASGVSLVLAGALLFGFRVRKRAPRWLTLMLIVVGGLAGIGGCGGGGASLTPGTYAYNITANQTGTSTSPFLTATTTINVTVPAGVPTNLSLQSLIKIKRKMSS